MDSQSRQDSLRNAWRALAVTGETQGWCTINIDEAGLCRAGMHLDDNEEAILFGFEKNSFSNLRSFPKGYGFSVIPVDLPFPEHNKTWVALVRNRSGNMAMFTLMAVDVLSAVERHVSNKLTDSFELFVRRVRAWQNFMRVGNSGILSPEDEIGLFGELLFLQELIQTGLPLDIAIRSWRGPSGDVHDFSLGSGAVEVKQLQIKAASWPEYHHSSSWMIALWLHCTFVLSDCKFRKMGTPCQSLLNQLQGFSSGITLMQSNFATESFQQDITLILLIRITGDLGLFPGPFMWLTLVSPG